MFRCCWLTAAFLSLLSLFIAPAMAQEGLAIECEALTISATNECPTEGLREEPEYHHPAGWRRPLEDAAIMAALCPSDAHREALGRLVDACKPLFPDHVSVELLEFIAKGTVGKPEVAHHVFARVVDWAQRTDSDLQRFDIDGAFLLTFAIRRLLDDALLDDPDPERTLAKAILTHKGDIEAMRETFDGQVPPEVLIEALDFVDHLQRMGTVRAVAHLRAFFNAERDDLSGKAEHLTAAVIDPEAWTHGQPQVLATFTSESALLLGALGKHDKALSLLFSIIDTQYPDATDVPEVLAAALVHALSMMVADCGPSDCQPRLDDRMRHWLERLAQALETGLPVARSASILPKDTVAYERYVIDPMEMFFTAFTALPKDTGPKEELNFLARAWRASQARPELAPSARKWLSPALTELLGAQGHAPARFLEPTQQELEALRAKVTEASDAVTAGLPLEDSEGRLTRELTLHASLGSPGGRETLDAWQAINTAHGLLHEAPSTEKVAHFEALASGLGPDWNDTLAPLKARLRTRLDPDPASELLLTGAVGVSGEDFAQFARLGWAQPAWGWRRAIPALALTYAQSNHPLQANLGGQARLIGTHRDHRIAALVGAHLHMLDAFGGRLGADAMVGPGMSIVSRSGAAAGVLQPKAPALDLNATGQLGLRMAWPLWGPTWLAPEAGIHAVWHPLTDRFDPGFFAGLTLRTTFNTLQE